MKSREDPGARLRTQRDIQRRRREIADDLIHPRGNARSGNDDCEGLPPCVDAGGERIQRRGSHLFQPWFRHSPANASAQPGEGNRCDARGNISLWRGAERVRRVLQRPGPRTRVRPHLGDAHVSKGFHKAPVRLADERLLAEEPNSAQRVLDGDVHITRGRAAIAMHHRDEVVEHRELDTRVQQASYVAPVLGARTLFGKPSERGVIVRVNHQGRRADRISANQPGTGVAWRRQELDEVSGPIVLLQDASGDAGAGPQQLELS